MRIKPALHKQAIVFVSGLFYFLIAGSVAIAQQKKKIPAPPKKPAIAAIASAIVPGAGQLYNQKYWKAPIVWASLGSAGYLIHSNQKTYAQYRDALKSRTDNDPGTTDPYENDLSDSDLLALQDQYRRSRDLWIILATLGYGLNIVDALVDAHLSSFDVSDDLSFHMKPMCLPNGTLTTHLSIAWKF